MPRKLKPQKQGEYRHERLGITIELMLDRNNFDFFAKMPDGTILRDPEYKKLYTKVAAHVSENSVLRWQAVISVNMLAPFGGSKQHPFVGFVPRRHWLAIRTDGRIVEGNAHLWDRSSFDMPSENAAEVNLDIGRHYGLDEAVTGKTIKLPWQSGSFTHGATYYLPYSEDAWQALQMIYERIGLLQQRLDDVLQEPANLLLVHQQLLMLPAITKDEPDELDHAPLCPICGSELDADEEAMIDAFGATWLDNAPEELIIWYCESCNIAGTMKEIVNSISAKN